MERPVPTRSPSVGEFVTYYDEFGVPHNALVTANWGGVENPNTSINVVYVSGDDSKTDSYGRQMERASSVVPGHLQSAHGRYYLLTS